jgi:putative nucleotidyltransferase with HDIG domain
VAFASQFVGEDFESQSGLTFTAGVLHDIGKLILAEAYQWDYAAVLNKSSRRNQPLADLEKATFGVDHAEVGARLLERWHFTPQMVASVRYHHAPLGAGELRRLAACINLGDTLAHSSGEDRAIHDFESDVAVTILGLGAEDVFRHRDRIKENLEFVEVMCRLRD